MRPLSEKVVQLLYSARTGVLLPGRELRCHGGTRLVILDALSLLGNRRGGYEQRGHHDHANAQSDDRPVEPGLGLDVGVKDDEADERCQIGDHSPPCTTLQRSVLDCHEMTPFVGRLYGRTDRKSISILNYSISCIKKQ